MIPDSSLDRKSFLPLSEINLSSAHTLHPKSVNPCHDLVALFRPLTVAEITANQPHVPPFLRARMAQQAAKEKLDSFLPSMVKGKQREDHPEQKMRIGLWRAISGVHVWDADVAGTSILDMAWSLDGLYLSLVMRVSHSDREDEPSLRLIHLSVQDGSLVHTVPLAVDAATCKGIKSLDMEWCESNAEWPKDAKGSAAMIIDSIPQPNPVEHFEIPERNNPMAAYNKKKVTVKNPNEPHPMLQSFPSTLDSQPPHVLCIPALSMSFLAGAFPLATKQSLPFRHKGFTAILQDPLRRGDMLVARAATRARLHCDTIMRGLEACWTVWRKGIMEELNERLDDLERCAADAGVSRDAAMADMLRLLVTGRSGDAVGQLIGGKLTEGILTKWMAAYDDCVDYLHETLSYSIFPAIERLLLLLDDLRGWSMYQSAYDLNLETSDVKDCIEWAKYLATRVMDMDKELADEADNFREFGKWLKYELPRATVHDPDDLAEAQIPTHDVAAAAAYLDMLADNTSKVASCFLIDAERLAGKWAVPQLPIHHEAQRPLATLLKDLMSSLRGDTATTADPCDEFPDRHESGISRRQDESSMMEESIIDVSTDSDLPAKTHPRGESPGPSGEDPLWAIADVMLGKVERLLSHAVNERSQSTQSTSTSRTFGQDGLFVKRVTEDEVPYTVFHVRSSRYLNVTAYTSAGPNVKKFALPDHVDVAGFDFFDDDELVITLRVTRGDSNAGILYLAALQLSDLHMMDQANSESQADIATLPISRSRRIGTTRSDAPPTSISLALNGRKGRRFACVGLSHGPTPLPGDEEGTRYVGVIDMDENESADEEDDAEDHGEASAEQKSVQGSEYNMDVDEDV